MASQVSLDPGIEKYLDLSQHFLHVILAMTDFSGLQLFQSSCHTWTAPVLQPSYLRFLQYSTPKISWRTVWSSKWRTSILKTGVCIYIYIFYMFIPFKTFSSHFLKLLKLPLPLALPGKICHASRRNVTAVPEPSRLPFTSIFASTVNASYELDGLFFAKITCNLCKLHQQLQSIMSCTSRIYKAAKR